MSVIDATTMPAPAEDAALEPGRGRAHFVAAERPFWRLVSRGAALLLVTLGLYRFWLATDVRRYLWCHTKVAGDWLEYIGTARELLLGFLIAIVLLVPVNVVLFVGTLSGGAIGQLGGTLALFVLVLLGQFAIYRARRYRLTRTVFRGIRFHQTGSAWRYAVCAMLWWGLVAATLGLAYPFAQASLERFKMSNTYYGDLRGHFVGSGLGLFFRGFVMWVIVMVPLLLGVVVAIGDVDWGVVAEMLQRRTDDIAGRFEAAGAGQAALLYPLFQAMMLRWWASGLCFGTLTVTSRLRIGAVYALYTRFLGYALLAANALAVLAAGALFAIGMLETWIGKGTLSELATTAILIVIYVVVALSYSAIYQATVKLRLWKLAVESIELSGVDALDRVKATGAAGSAVGEGLADALNVGGI
jgi:uncharacterized membrane protein YjgN (DUF898 family)